VVNACLSLLVASVKVAVEDVVVKDCSEADTDSIRDIQKLISSEIGQRTKCAENSCPFTHGECVSAHDLGMRSGIDVEGHEGVDVVVDVRKIHESCGMADGDDSADHIFFELGLAYLPQLSVLLVEVDLTAAERQPGCLCHNLQHCYNPLLIMIVRRK